MSKLLNAEGFTIFVRQFCKVSLTFRYKFRILVLALYPHLSVNLLKALMKSAKFVSGF